MSSSSSVNGNSSLDGKFEPVTQHTGNLGSNKVTSDTSSPKITRVRELSISGNTSVSEAGAIQKKQVQHIKTPSFKFEFFNKIGLIVKKIVLLFKQYKFEKLVNSLLKHPEKGISESQEKFLTSYFSNKNLTSKDVQLLSKKIKIINELNPDSAPTDASKMITKILRSTSENDIGRILSLVLEDQEIEPDKLGRCIGNPIREFYNETVLQRYADKTDQLTLDKLKSKFDDNFKSDLKIKFLKATPKELEESSELLRYIADKQLISDILDKHLGSKDIEKRQGAELKAALQEKRETAVRLFKAIGDADLCSDFIKSQIKDEMEKSETPFRVTNTHEMQIFLAFNEVFIHPIVHDHIKSFKNVNDILDKIPSIIKDTRFSIYGNLFPDQSAGIKKQVFILHVVAAALFTNENRKVIQDLQQLAADKKALETKGKWTPEFEKRQKKFNESLKGFI